MTVRKAGPSEGPPTQGHERYVFCECICIQLAIIFPLQRMGCHKSDRCSATGVRRGENKLPGFQKQHFLGGKDVRTT